MEGQGENTKSNAKALNFKSLNTNMSPLNVNAPDFVGRGINHHQQRFSTFGPYAWGSDSPNLDSPPILHLLWNSGSSGSGSGSEGRAAGRTRGSLLSPFPRTSMESFETPSPLRSTPVFKTPVKVEEDVLVMDGILVDRSSNSKASGRSSRMRPSLMSSDSGKRSSTYTSSGRIENRVYYKSEKCQNWQDSGTCRFGSKCHFAHGIQELRTYNKSELCKSFSSGSCTYGANCRFSHHQVKADLSSIEPASAEKASSTSPAVISPIKPENTGSNRNHMITTTLTSSDWSPLDDGIPITLPSVSSENAPSKEDVDTHIQSVLLGPSVRKRLSAFIEFCPE